MLKDLKVYLMNSGAFALSFTNIENWLKIILLVLSIVYTIINLYKITKKNENQ